MIDVRELADYCDHHHYRPLGATEVLESCVDKREALAPLPPEHQGFIGFVRLKERDA